MGGAVPLAQNPPCLSGRWDGSGDRPFRGKVLNKLLTYNTQWDNKNYWQCAHYWCSNDATLSLMFRRLTPALP